MVGVSLMFLISIIAILALISLSIFFIVFGIMKKMTGFVIAGAALLLLFVGFFVVLGLLNFGIRM